MQTDVASWIIRSGILDRKDRSTMGLESLIDFGTVILLSATDRGKDRFPNEAVKDLQNERTNN